jgi:hypothetical protein
VLQSDEYLNLSSLRVTFNFILQPSGGKGSSTESRDRDSILNKKSVVKVVNDDDNCFWYALNIVMNKEITALKDNRNTKIREKLGKELCNKCKMQWDSQVDFLKLPLIEERFNCNILLLIWKTYRY